jgi:hypothetical protein
LLRLAIAERRGLAKAIATVQPRSRPKSRTTKGKAAGK